MHEQLIPFLDHESATKWLSDHVSANGLDRKGIYCLHVINSLIQDGNNLFERLPQKAISGFAKGTRRAVEASVLLRAGSAAGQGSPRSKQREQERLIREYARQEKCWTDDAPAYLGRRFKKLAEGGEAEVFLAGDHVYKFIANVYFDNFETVLDRVALHNLFAPEVPLTVVGYGTAGSGVHGIIVRQPFVQGKPVSEMAIQKHIENLGFTKIKDIIATTEYVNELYYLGDMHDENVLLVDGEFFAMIDTDSRLNTPELGYGGKRAIPGLAYSDESVRRIDAVMKELAPVRIPQWKCEADYGRNVARELERTGRLNGSLAMTDDHGRERRFTLQVDPLDRTQALRAWCDGIAVMLDREKGFTEEEKAAFARGEFLRRGGKTYVFDLDCGRVREWRTRSIKIGEPRKRAAERTPAEAPRAGIKH